MKKLLLFIDFLGTKQLNAVNFQKMTVVCYVDNSRKCNHVIVIVLCF